MSLWITMMGFDDPLHKASDDEKFGAPVGVFFYILDEKFS